MKNNCGCCEGLDKLTPLSTANRPGLDALIYRVGSHATFMESMLACLSNKDYPELAALTSRSKDDTSIALLDAWATVADVLTFYQERIANEAYLRTSLERRSILELARLVGYQLRPGVSASVYLGFTMDKDAVADIPIGTRAQSIPGPNELPQAFETSETIPAREEWNNLKPRLTKPQLITNASSDIALPNHILNLSEVYFDGTDTNLKPNDPLLFVFSKWSGDQKIRYVAEVESQLDREGRWERTLVRLQPNDPASQSAGHVTSNQIDTPLTAIAIGGDRVIRVVDKYLDAEAFGVSVTSAMAKRVVKLIERIQKPVTVDSSDVDIVTLFDEVLRELREEYAIAIKRHYDNLESWVGGLVKELEEIMTEAKKAPQILSSSPFVGQNSYDDEPTPPDTVLGTLIEQNLFEPLLQAPSIQPANAQRLPRDVAQTFAAQSDTAPRLLTALKSQLKPVLYNAIKHTQPERYSSVQVYAMRTMTLFGHNAAKKTYVNPKNHIVEDYGEWPVVEFYVSSDLRNYHEERDVIQLSESDNKILPDSWLVVNTAQTTLTTVNTIFSKAQNPDFDDSISNTGIPSTYRADYGMSSKTTRVKLADPINSSNSINWITTDLGSYTPNADEDFKAIRRTVIYGQGATLTLAEAPIVDDVNANVRDKQFTPMAGNEIELAELYDGFETGRWIIVSGERFDAPGVNASELLMLTAVEQNIGTGLQGDKPHTNLKLAEAMSYQYKRDGVTIYGNVVKATQGETRAEVLGSGDGSRSFQQFTLSFSPLTYVPANTTSGVESTLQLRVNGVLWKDAVSIVGLDANDRQYITHTDNESKTSIQFGDGKRGLRLPTGVENVTAIYRSGIGKGGNVNGEQISLLATRPLGVKGVINPLPATGGADRETRDQARRNAPFAVMALDRLVSVQDYADFARTFAGIGKASATRLTDGNRQLVYVTIASAEDIPISKSSDLYRSLFAALHKFGDPHQPIQLAIRELILLIIHARVRVSPEYQWETLEPKIRTALLDHFSFERRDLGQDALLSEAISVIQGITGVVYVDVDVFDGLVEIEPIEDLIDSIEGLGIQLGEENQPKPRVPGNMAYSQKPIIDNHDQQFGVASKQTKKAALQLSSTSKSVLKPAQIAILKPDIKDTLILTELT
ncbi:MAG: putative baseplate assembly protein [Gammaproteobacteria bacterium]|nr:putative baseplate assembly protein [Gammaproteobacteria bacterium]